MTIQTTTSIEPGSPLNDEFYRRLVDVHAAIDKLMPPRRILTPVTQEQLLAVATEDMVGPTFRTQVLQAVKSTYGDNYTANVDDLNALRDLFC